MEHTNNENKAAGAPSALNVGLERIVGYVYERIDTGEIEQPYGIRFDKDTADFYFNRCFGGDKRGTHRMISLARANVELRGCALLRSPA